MLTSITGAVPGPVRLALSPHLREPMRWFTDPSVERIGLGLATQLSKTLYWMSCLGYVIDVDPGSAGILLPTQTMAKQLSKERLQNMLRDSPGLRRHLTGTDDDFQLLHYTLDRMSVYFMWGGSETSTRSHSIRYLFKDEISGIDSGAARDADDRTKNFWNRKIVETSTPKHDKDSIWRFSGLQLKSDNIRGEKTLSTRHWEATTDTSVYFRELRCPNCHEWIRLELENIRWPEDAAIRSIGDKGWCECQNCANKLHDGERTRLLQDPATARWKSDNPGGRWRFCHANALYGMFESSRAGEIASRMIRARKSPDPEDMQRFANNDAAMPWSLEESGQDIVTEKAIEIIRTELKRNEVPLQARALSMGADVRNEQVHWIVDAWGPNGECWTISWEILLDLAEIEHKIRTSTWTHPLGYQMKCTVGGIDCRYKKDDVINMCRRLAQDGYNIKAVRGETDVIEHGRGGQLPYITTDLDRDAAGKPLIGSLKGYRINTMYWKEWLYGRINPRKDQAKLFHLPVDIDETLDRHLQSETETVKRDRGGKLKRYWVLRKGFEQNHYLDASVYSKAIAHAFGFFAITAETPVDGIKIEAPGVAPAPLADAPVKKQPFIPRGFKIR